MCSKTEKDSYNQISYALHRYFHHHLSYSQHLFYPSRYLIFPQGIEISFHLSQCCQLSQIIHDTPDFGLYLPVSRLEYEISKKIAEVCHFFSRLDFLTMKFQLFCIVTAILMLESNVSPLTPACHSKIM